MGNWFKSFHFTLTIFVWLRKVFITLFMYVHSEIIKKHSSLGKTMIKASFQLFNENNERTFLMKHEIIRSTVDCTLLVLCIFNA